MGAANAVQVGEYDRAEEWAQRAVQLEPENFTVRYNAACAYAVIGKPDIAMEHLEYICSNVPRARQWLLRIVPGDTQLNSLRALTEFQILLARLEDTTPGPQPA
jgi:adenylate cyclase